MFFGAEITGIGIFRHLKTLIRKQPLVVFRPILCKRSLVHFHGLCGNGELDCHRIGVSHIQCLLILYHVTVFEHQFLHFGILIRFLEDDVSVYRLVLLEHFIQHNGIGSRFGSVVILGGLSLVNSLHAYTFASLKRKKLISTTPLNDALNALILALNASAAAFVLLFTKKFRILS